MRIPLFLGHMYLLLPPSDLVNDNIDIDVVRPEGEAAIPLPRNHLKKLRSRTISRIPHRRQRSRRRPAKLAPPRTQRRSPEIPRAVRERRPITQATQRTGATSGDHREELHHIGVSLGRIGQKYHQRSSLNFGGNRLRERQLDLFEEGLMPATDSFDFTLR